MIDCYFVLDPRAHWDCYMGSVQGGCAQKLYFSSFDDLTYIGLFPICLPIILAQAGAGIGKHRMWTCCSCVLTYYNLGTT